MKKIISLVLCIVMILPLILPSYVMASDTSSHFEYEAQMLYNLGLFKGTENGFDLDKPCDRLQGSTLFIRLLGEEKDAIDNPKSHPFSDVKDSWASPYVGQMYQQGYTKGISNTEYGISNMTANQFATFCLRALNYNDSAGDFHYNTALDKMLELHIINQEAYNIISSQEFTRDCAVKLAYSTLFADIKGTEKEYKQRFNGKITYPLGTRDILITRLLNNSVIDKEVFENTIFRIYDDLYFYTSYESASQLALQYEEAGKDTYYFKYDDNYTDFVEFCFILPHSYNTINGVSQLENDLITVNYTAKETNILKYQFKYSDIYRCSKYIKNPSSIELTEPEKEIVEYTQKNFLDVYIKEGMSDYDKVLAAYEFTMDSITYGYSGTLNSSIYMSLFEHQGTCGAYADLLLYLLNVLDFEAYVIGGMATEEPHGWNKVKLGNDYYNLDATWDDNNYTAGKSYDYFLVSDEYISHDHFNATSYIDSINEKIKATNTQFDPK